ncbi:MAG: L-threonylcarbamoyladenylate synthase [Desulfovibrio sp.]|jgi:L-threonylcarbamoyladenylate synthase
MQTIQRIFLEGGVVVYPTETLYALGCHGFLRDAALRVAAIKGRPKAKPLPLIIGGTSMLELVTDEITGTIRALAEAFWPGPLSILVRARSAVPRPVRDEQGLVSVRSTPHPLAAQICRELDAPLVATSANFSGNPPAGSPRDLDPDLLAKTDAALLEEPFPPGGAPSTLIRPLAGGRVEILRAGAVARQSLEEKGFAVS